MKHTILILEDEKPLVDAISIKLRSRGYETVTARSTEQALDYLKNGVKVEVIWLDHYLLGEKTGLDFLAEIKAHDEWKRIPCFVVTNTATQDKKKTYIKLGVEKYFVKAESHLEDIIKEIDKNID